jgi:hypothetical protein
MMRLARLAAVVLPILGLAGLWFQSDNHYRQGTEWEVPIQGYDPRDYLRGHYLEFSYDWPGIDEFRDLPPQLLCLEGDAPSLEKVTAYARASERVACAHPLRADRTGVYGWDALVRGRLYLDQNRARELDEQLRDPDLRGIVTIRQRADGSFTPIAIRFRPLTAAEKAEREARNARPFVPPPIMATPSENPRP